MITTSRFGVRQPSAINGNRQAHEVYDRITGTTVASGLGAIEARANARWRNHDTSGFHLITGEPAPDDHPWMLCLGPPEIEALRDALADGVSRTGALEELYELFVYWSDA